MIWNDCEKQEDGWWIDQVTNIRFSQHETYENSSEGGFLTSPEDWARSDRSKIPLLTQTGNIITTEGTYTDVQQYDKYVGSKILLIGAGPSTELLTDRDIESADYIWSCNHFFKHSKIKEFKLDLVSLGNEVDLSSQELITYLKQHKTNVLFNFTIGRDRSAISQFIKVYPFFSGYASRWFGRPGEIPRTAVMAALWGCKKLSIIGMDGHSPEVLEEKKSDSVFEPGKYLKLSSYDYDLQRRQFVVWCDYMTTRFPGMKLKNLGSRYEHNLWKFIGES